MLTWKTVHIVTLVVWGAGIATNAWVHRELNKLRKRYTDAIAWQVRNGALGPPQSSGGPWLSHPCHMADHDACLNAAGWCACGCHKRRPPMSGGPFLELGDEIDLREGGGRRGV